jgi:hypothetical protein
MVGREKGAIQGILNETVRVHGCESGTGEDRRE